MLHQISVDNDKPIWLLGRMKFSDWLIKNNRTGEEFGREISVTGQTVRRWCYGERFPEPELIELVRMFTDGAVTEVDHHKARLEYVRKRKASR